MPIYRVRKALDRGSHIIEPGQLIEIDWLGPEDIGRLETVGAVARVKGPPLVELPGWRRRGQRLAEIGIRTAEQYLEAEPESVAAHMAVKVSTAEKWKTEVRKWLAPPKVRKGRG
jgi:hypothetical protein